MLYLLIYNQIINIASLYDPNPLSYLSMIKPASENAYRSKDNKGLYKFPSSADSLDISSIFLIYITSSPYWLWEFIGNNPLVLSYTNIEASLIKIIDIILSNAIFLDFSP